MYIYVYIIYIKIYIYIYTYTYKCICYIYNTIYYIRWDNSFSNMLSEQRSIILSFMFFCNLQVYE